MENTGLFNAEGKALSIADAMAMLPPVTFLEKVNRVEVIDQNGRSYSLDEVREIALEYRNACMYGHSHKLTRFELQAELRKIDEKHGLDYKEGVDYNFA